MQPGTSPVVEAPRRIVSLDVCADQMVMQFAPDHILALSPESRTTLSYLRAQAARYPQTRVTVEAILALKPDLVVRAYGGGADLSVALERLGIPVLQLGFASDLQSVRQGLLDVSAQLDAPQRGEAIVAAFDARLGPLVPEAAPPEPDAPRALYLVSGGVTTGPGGLVDQLLRQAGLANIQTKPGWRSLPLESMAQERADIIAAAFFDAPSVIGDRWSSARHPLVQQQLATGESVPLSGAIIGCGGWFLADAVEALREAATQVRS
jgi:iron complex transport system substrate-binding protein